MPINTIFQLLADEGPPALAAAERIALVPDLLALWLSGELANELTTRRRPGCSTPAAGTWARRADRPARACRPRRSPARPSSPAPRSARCSRHHELGDVPVHAVAGHDTASAFAAAPLRTPHAAVLSSRTWSLLGLELDEPVLDAEPRAFNLTNERGVDGTIRLLRNVMGLWLVQECTARWAAVLRGAASASPTRRAADVPLFDPDADAFLAPRRHARADRGGRAARAARRRRERRGELVRSILVSLACKYRLVLERLERVTGRDVDVVHVIGGGVRNELLCRLTADCCGRTRACRAGRGDRARQRARAGARDRRARLAGRHARGRRRVRRSGRLRAGRSARRSDAYRRFLRSRAWPSRTGAPQLPDVAGTPARSRSRRHRGATATPGTRFATFRSRAGRATYSSGSTTPPRCTG